jgi:hypothetical protein
MSPRCLLRLVIASVTAAAGIAFSSPASASVTYDPATKTGFAGFGDVRNAFGWTDEMLASRAPDVLFGHDFWTDDTYTASCGENTVAIVHHREFGRFELAGALAQHRGRGAAGYRGKLIGFRIIGATAGISGTSVPPAAGQPCPQAPGPDATIDTVHLVSSTTGWALTVSFQDVRRELRTGHESEHGHPGSGHGR